MLKTKTGTILEGAGGVMFLPEPMTCKGCNRQAMIVVNQGGKTRCLPCAGGDVADLPFVVGV